MTVFFFTFLLCICNFPLLLFVISFAIFCLWLLQLVFLNLIYVDLRSLHRGPSQSSMLMKLLLSFSHKVYWYHHFSAKFCVLSLTTFFPDPYFLPLVSSLRIVLNISLWKLLRYLFLWLNFWIQFLIFPLFFLPLHCWLFLLSHS